ncbi:hypothetical protein UlMin_030653 [Ulmus minor]
MEGRPSHWMMLWEPSSIKSTDGRVKWVNIAVTVWHAGIVVAYYLTADQPNRDEIEYEFLVNVDGQPYILQTNIFADDFDNNEERINLWFDPTKDFHTYSILWNLYQIVVYRNHADKGVGFPRWQPMSIKVSQWKGDSWATRGGKEKIDWSKGPFVASLGNHKIDGAVSSTNRWHKESFSSLTSTQRRLFNWVRKCHMIYDYCQDNQRFQNNFPKECSLVSTKALIKINKISKFVLFFIFYFSFIVLFVCGCCQKSEIINEIFVVLGLIKDKA